MEILPQNSNTNDPVTNMNTSNENINSADDQINIKKYSIEKLTKLKETVCQMDVQQQIGILKILENESQYLTRNNNGFFCNLVSLSSSTIDEMEKYINFCKETDKTLEEVEQVKTEMKNSMVTEEE